MGDARTGARAARGAKRPTRRRAVGTRDRIIAHLVSVGGIADTTGMASTKLAEAVGYPGSSVAFAQLLAGMERDGLIAREVRGKRTYRITLPERAGPERAGPDGAGPASAAADAGRAPGGFDYDELARRLLVQILRKLASVSVTEPDLATVDAPSALAEAAGADRGDLVDRVDREKTAVLRETVAGLERELADVWTRHTTLTAENARLRQQLTQARSDLARERTRRAALAGELNQAESVVLERLLGGPSGNGDAAAG